MSDNENAVIGWDDDVDESMVQKQNEYVVLPNGTYPFKVVKVERGHFGGSQKMPACGKVNVEMVFTSPNGEVSYVRQNFFMTYKTLFKIYQFLESVGIHKAGDGAGPIPWSKVDASCCGIAKLKIREFRDKDGQTRTGNEVERFLPPKKSNVPDTIGDEEY